MTNDNNPNRINYNPDEIYHKVGNDWISIDQFLTKKDVIKLVDLLGSYIVTMAKCQGNIGIDVASSFIEKLEELKEELKK